MDTLSFRGFTFSANLLGLCTLVVAITLSILFYEETQQTLQLNRDNAHHETQRVIAELEKRLQRIPDLASELAGQLSDAKLSEAQLKQRITHALNNNPELLGIGVAFQPYAFNESLRLYAPYLVHQTHKLRWIELDDYYDYTASDYPWYSDAIHQPAHWQEPAYNQAINQNAIQYVMPIRHHQGEEPVGLLFISYGVDEIQQIIKTLNLGQSGYSILLSKEGVVIDHPVQEYVDALKRVDELPSFNDDPILMKAAKQARQGKMVEQEMTLSENDYRSLINATPIPSTDWTLISSFDKYPPLIYGSQRYHDILWLIASWVIVIICLTPLLARKICQNSFHSYWCAALLISCAFTAGIAMVWNIAYDATPEKLHADATPITNPSELALFTNNYTAHSLDTNSSVPIYLPTGMFIQSIEFSSANNVILTGYVWQRYALGVHDDLKRGIVMPEAESLDISEAYHRTEQGYEVIGWYFRTTLRESFDYARYPLDQQAVWIRLWHAEFDQNVVLVPDLAAYDHLNPRGLPGIEQDFVLPGWQLTHSYFEYRKNNYSTNFGIDNYVGKTQFPELYFNIAMKRNFIDPFISNLAPVVVVLLMLFAIVITISMDDKRINLLGFNASAILASCSALFFVVLIAHIDMRGSLEATSLIFMEDFYFLTYLSILMITVNSIIFTWGIDIKFITYQDNILPKISFWPLITGSMFLLSFGTFY